MGMKGRVKGHKKRVRKTLKQQTPYTKHKGRITNYHPPTVVEADSIPGEPEETYYSKMDPTLGWWMHYNTKNEFIGKTSVKKEVIRSNKCNFQIEAVDGVWKITPVPEEVEE